MHSYKPSSHYKSGLCLNCVSLTYIIINAGRIILYGMNWLSLTGRIILSYLFTLFWQLDLFMVDDELSPDYALAVLTPIMHTEILPL